MRLLLLWYNWRYGNTEWGFKNFFSRQCGTLRRDGVSMRVHLKKCESAMKRIPCLKCDLDFKRQEDMEAHALIHFGQVKGCSQRPRKAKKGLSKLAQLYLNINVYWYSLFVLNWPLFIYFCPFLNTMTNIVQNLTTNGKSVDVMIGIRTQDHGMVIAY